MASRHEVPHVPVHSESAAIDTSTNAAHQAEEKKSRDSHSGALARTHGKNENAANLRILAVPSLGGGRCADWRRRATAVRCQNVPGTKALLGKQKMNREMKVEKFIIFLYIKYIYRDSLIFSSSPASSTVRIVITILYDGTASFDNWVQSGELVA